LTWKLEFGFWIFSGVWSLMREKTPTNQPQITLIHFDLVRFAAIRLESLFDLKFEILNLKSDQVGGGQSRNARRNKNLNPDLPGLARTYPDLV
jgi:hypothetical protein